MWTVRTTIAATLLAVLCAGAVFSDTGTQNLLGLWVGDLSYEAGTTLALELSGTGLGSCSGLSVVRLSLLNDADTFLDRTYDTPVALDDWLDVVPLSDENGGPLPTGDYSIVIFTEAGAFVLQFSIDGGGSVCDGEESGTFSARIAFCGLTVQVYRLATAADDGSEIGLRVGDGLLVALDDPGGHGWTLARSAPQLAVSQGETRDNFSKSGSATPNGLTLFRVQAIAAGSGMLQFQSGGSSGSGNGSDTVSLTVHVNE